MNLHHPRPEEEIVKLLKSSDPIDVSRGRFYAAGINGVVKKWVDLEISLNTLPHVLLGAFTSNLARLCIGMVKTLSEGASNQAQVARFVGDNVRNSVFRHYHVPADTREALLLSAMCDLYDDPKKDDIWLDRFSKLVDQARGKVA